MPATGLRVGSLVGDRLEVGLRVDVGFGVGIGVSEARAHEGLVRRVTGLVGTGRRALPGGVLRGGPLGDLTLEGHRGEAHGRAAFQVAVVEVAGVGLAVGFWFGLGRCPGLLGGRRRNGSLELEPPAGNDGRAAGDARSAAGAGSATAFGSGSGVRTSGSGSGSGGADRCEGDGCGSNPLPTGNLGTPAGPRSAARAE